MNCREARGRRTLLALAASAVLLVGAMAPPAASAGPWKGVYDCYRSQYNQYVFGGYQLVYQHSARLKKRGRYQQAFGREGAKLTKPRNGRWKWRKAKSKIVFTKGPFKHIYGKWHGPEKNNPRGFYNEIKKDGTAKAATCYPTGIK